MVQEGKFCQQNGLVFGIRHGLFQADCQQNGQVFDIRQGLLQAEPNGYRVLLTSSVSPLVFVPGNREQPVMYNNTKMYYRGARVLHAVVNYLLRSAGLVDAERVIFGGDSGKKWQNVTTAIVF